MSLSLSLSLFSLPFLLFKRLTMTDYKIYEQVVEMTHRFKPIFYESNE